MPVFNVPTPKASRPYWSLSVDIGDRVLFRVWTGHEHVTRSGHVTDFGDASGIEWFTVAEYGLTPFPIRAVMRVDHAESL